MSGPAWAEELSSGLGALVAELERAREDARVVGDGLGSAEVPSVDWSALIEKARGLGARVEGSASEYTRIIRGANEQLATASKKIATLQGMVRELESRTQLSGPGVGAPRRTGLGDSQTVYLSAGATAGIAAGALLIGGVGGYAAKAYLDKRKKKKAAEASEALELAEGDEGDEGDEELKEAPKPKRIARKVK